MNNYVHSQGKNSFTLYLGTNYSLSNSFKTIETTGGFNLKNGFPSNDYLTYFPYSLDVKYNREINNKVKIGTGIGINQTYYDIRFQSYKDPSAAYTANEFRYQLNTISIPITVSYSALKSKIIDINVEVGLTLNINSIIIFGASSRLLLVYPDTTSMALNFLQEIETGDKIGLGSIIGLDIKSNQILKRFLLRPELHLQYINSLRTLQQMSLYNLDKGTEEHHSAKVNILPSFFSIKIGYLLYTSKPKDNIPKNKLKQNNTQ